MHELSIAQDILREIERFQKEKGFSKIQSVQLTIGKLSSINSDALREALAIATKETFLEGAAFVIEEVAPEVQCRACGTKFAFGQMQCPECGSLDKEIIRGRELVISSVEAEK